MAIAARLGPSGRGDKKSYDVLKFLIFKSCDFKATVYCLYRSVIYITSRCDRSPSKYSAWEPQINLMKVPARASGPKGGCDVS